MLCGYLESQGIQAMYNKSAALPALRAYTGAAGPHDILVRADQLGAARDALAALQKSQT